MPRPPPRVSLAATREPRGHLLAGRPFVQQVAARSAQFIFPAAEDELQAGRDRSELGEEEADERWLFWPLGGKLNPRQARCQL